MTQSDLVRIHQALHGKDDLVVIAGSIIPINKKNGLRNLTFKDTNFWEQNPDKPASAYAKMVREQKAQITWGFPKDKNKGSYLIINGEVKQNPQ